MAIPFTKSFSASNDGEILYGADIGNLQSDIDANTVHIADTQTITGNKLFSGTATFGAGTAITKIVVYSQAIDPASVAASSISAQTFTVTGLTTDDKVFVNPGINTIGIAGCYVSAANTLTVIFVNPTAAAIDPASSTWKIVAIRS